MDELIFPQKITDNMNVKDYKMVYYKPWDAHYLSYLVVQFCNYFMDLDYKKYISEEFLPKGFDTTNNNPYKHKMINQKS